MRRLLPLLLCAAFVSAQEDKKTQVDWIGDWDQAFRLAKESDRAVMVCINSIDGERANDRAATQTYTDAEFVALSSRFVMVVSSTREHMGMFGHCKRFGRVTCTQHKDCDKALRAAHGETFMVQGTGGEIISPQHAWFSSDGKLIRRKEFELGKPELMKMMREVLAGLNKQPEGDAEGALDPDVDPTTVPLSQKDQAELERVQTAKRDGRRAAIVNLLNTQKKAAITALVDLLEEVRKAEILCDVIRGLGRARALDAREAIEEHLNHKEALVRSFAAVALEEMQQQVSVEPLLKRAKRERDTYGRKNMYRALGRCGGPAADKAAAKALLKAVGSDKQTAVRKHAALALRWYAGKQGAKLVKKRMETLALRERNSWVRGAIVYSLAYVGDRETTLPVFEKILAKVNNDLSRGWMRDAIKVLKKRGNWTWTFWLWDEDRSDPARDRA